MLEKYKVEVSKRGAYKGRGEPSERIMVQRVHQYQSWKWSEDCWARIFPWFRRCDAAKKHAGKSDRKGGDETAAEDEDHDRDDKENPIKRQRGREQQLVGQ